MARTLKFAAAGKHFVRAPMSFYSPSQRRIVLLLLGVPLTHAQPAPWVQERIINAIHNAASAPVVDYTSFVNPFIGTANFGDVCPGASVPFGMAKFTTDNTGYAPAGYVADPAERIRGLSPLHDSGTGSSLGSYGNFEIMPLLCPNGFETCTTRLDDRMRYRKNLTDDASPGYFAQTLDNEIKMEATATRRAGLERFTFPEGSGKPYFVLDLANDLPGSWGGGHMNIDPAAGRITLGGNWRPSFGPGLFFYEAYACYDLLNGGMQKLDEYGVWTGDRFGGDAKGKGLTTLDLSINLIGSQPYQSGALFSYADDPTEIIIRVGVSFISAEQACANAESEVGTATFETIHDRAKALWQEKLSRIEIDVARTNETVVEMLYSSLYRSFLTPNNATGEVQGVFKGTSSPYFDSLYCTWDTFRTFYPLLSLTSPHDYAEIVENYIDGWRKNGWIPECRSNNLPGWTQGGSDGTNILADFAVKYHTEATSLGVSIAELYQALKSDGEIGAKEWNIQGRQIGPYKQYQYNPFGVLDTNSTGRQTRESSRTLEYAYNDFAIRQVALLVGDAETERTYTERSLWYRNVWDPNVESDGFKGFMQKRAMNGSFIYGDPANCSPKDNSSRACSLTQDNTNGFYESSSWEYSFFAPHDTAWLIGAMGGNKTFVRRLDHFFEAGYYLAGNEPSFQTPVRYHYANQPAKSVERVREVVNTNFGIGSDGLPGNDDQAAMATFLIFHLLGLYPVPSTTQFLLVSPFLPTYVIHTGPSITTNFTFLNFSPESVNTPIPAGAVAYVKSVTINGKLNAEGSRCFIDFYDVFKTGGEVVVELTADRDSVETEGCGGPIPDSLSTGGWAKAR